VAAFSATSPSVCVRREVIGAALVGRSKVGRRSTASGERGRVFAYSTPLIRPLSRGYARFRCPAPRTGAVPRAGHQTLRPDHTIVDVATRCAIRSARQERIRQRHSRARQHGRGGGGGSVYDVLRSVPTINP
jgi:hypothetical protein